MVVVYVRHLVHPALDAEFERDGSPAGTVGHRGYESAYRTAVIGRRR